jgi:hypothetical protein
MNSNHFLAIRQSPDDVTKVDYLFNCLENVKMNFTPEFRARHEAARPLA